MNTRTLNKTRSINNVEIFLTDYQEEIERELEKIQDSIDSVFAGLDVPEEDQFIDVRLNLQVDQYFNPDDLRLLQGDSSFDQDHRGYWSCSIIDNQTDCADVAYDLVHDLLDNFAMSI